MDDNNTHGFESMRRWQRRCNVCIGAVSGTPGFMAGIEHKALLEKVVRRDC